MKEKTQNKESGTVTITRDDLGRIATYETDKNIRIKYEYKEDKVSFKGEKL